MSGAVIQQDAQKLSAEMAKQCGVSAAVFFDTVKAQCFPQGRANVSELVMFLRIAQRYNLDPFTREIYAFPRKGGGVQTILSIDGWLKLVNSHEKFDGMEFKEEVDDQGNPVSCTCIIWRSDRSHPTVITEWFAECNRSSDPWKQFPRRMLRHKAVKECARYAFGFSRFNDEDGASGASDHDIEVSAQPQASIGLSASDALASELRQAEPAEDSAESARFAEACNVVENLIGDALGKGITRSELRREMSSKFDFSIIERALLHLLDNNRAVSRARRFYASDVGVEQDAKQVDEPAPAPERESEEVLSVLADDEPEVSAPAEDVSSWFTDSTE